MKRAAVLGAGSWGSALAIALADNGHDVRLWTHRKEQADTINKTHKNEQYLEIMIPKQITAYANMSEAIKDVDVIVMVVPSKAMREVCQELNNYVKGKPIIVHASKGIEPTTLHRISQVIGEEMDAYNENDVVVLSGPSHAEEVAQRLPTTVTVSSNNQKNAQDIQDLFMNEVFRVYTSTDVIGIELGGALKNIIALGAGISDGLGYGDNAKSALITRGLAEISRLGTKMGASPFTFLGLSGVGDLIVTCTSMHSRNWRAGHLLGKGQALDEVLEQMGMVVEGVRTTQAAHQFASEHNIEMPITEGLFQILFEDKEPRQVVDELMNRTKRDEMDDLKQLLHNQ